jgi:hypothetical protein
MLVVLCGGGLGRQKFSLEFAEKFWRAGGSRHEFHFASTSTSKYQQHCQVMSELLQDANLLL